MRTHVFSGKLLTVILAADVVGGGFVVCGNQVGVATTDGKTGDAIEVMFEEVHELPKVTGTAFAIGDELYLDIVAGKLTKVKTAGNPYAGTAAKPSESAEDLCHVKLAGVPTQQAANVATIATANGSDAGTTQTLANATKTTVNSILAALKAAGIMIKD